MYECFIHLLRLIFGGFYYLLFKNPYIGDIWDERLDINKSDIVLEVGSGWNPSIRSDVLVEKFVFDKSERRYTAYIPRSRPFIVADGCDLPFVSNSFDYIICRHVIEHLEKPEKLLEEFKRVSKKGFISAPSGFWESVSSGKYHKWFIFNVNRRLILEQKISMADRRFKRDELKEKNEKEVKYEYGSSVPLNWQIIKKTPVESFVCADIDQEYDKEILKSSDRTYPFMVKIIIFFKEVLRKFFFKTSTDFDIFNFLACPDCKKKLKKINGELHCDHCQLRYELINMIPILLREKAKKIQ